MIIKLKKIIIIIFVCVVLLSTTGCWDYKEISDKIIVAGIAVDYDKENNGILLTIEIILPEESNKGSNFIPKIYQSTGKNMIDATKNVMSKAGHELLWSHSKIFILSEDIFKEKNLFIGIMDWIKRDFESRQNTHLILSKEKTASDILTKSNPQTEKITSFYLDQLILSYTENGYIVKTSYWEFVDNLNSLSSCASLTCVHLENSDTGILPYLVGTELISKNTPICFLDGNQTKILLLLQNKLKTANFILNQSKKDMTQNVSFTINNNEVTIEPIYIKNKLSVRLHLDLDAIIEEVDTEKDIFTPDDLKDLEASLKIMIAQEVENFIEYSQKIKTDVLGFGNKTLQKYPNLLKKSNANWDDEFTKLQFNVKVDLKISGSEKSMKKTKMG